MKKLMEIVCLCLLLCGCGNTLDDSFDKEALKAQAEQVIAYMNAHDYEAVAEMGNEQLHTPDLAQKLDAAWTPASEKFGTFTSYDNFDYAQKDAMAVVVVIARYQNNKVQFTISFDEDMKLAGIYFK